MPNHITNILKISGDPKQMQLLFEAVQQDEIGLGSIDFEKVIPMPESVYRGDFGPRERAQYGKNNWYDWRLNNWGSKWNSYGYDSYDSSAFDGETLNFQTAWLSVAPIVEKLAVDYPDLSFTYQWADENFGYNVGVREYSNGEETACQIPQGGSKEALELASIIYDIPLDEIGFLYNEETGEYEYHNDEEASMTLQM